jgi:hypothetical protein
VGSILVSRTSFVTDELLAITFKLTRTDKSLRRKKKKKKKEKNTQQSSFVWTARLRESEIDSPLSAQEDNQDYSV